METLHGHVLISDNCVIDTTDDTHRDSRKLNVT